VDEIFYSRRHDLKKAFEAVPKGAFSLFLGHSPDIYAEVEAYGAHLYLCGHTHQGQIRFPWIGPVFTNTVAPRKFSDGYWQFKNLIGYTGAGVGSGVHLVRFLCPPEIAVITLRRKKS
jgi:predicted MPP superfamily phosphohydrolase